ncbi:unnamed protein product, partial [marine sediment metagenome]
MSELLLVSLLYLLTEAGIEVAESVTVGCVWLRRQSVHMVASALQEDRTGPFGLAVSGEAGQYLNALRLIVGPRWLRAYRVDSDREVLQVVRAGVADALVLDEDAIEIDGLKLLRS